MKRIILIILLVNLFYPLAFSEDIKLLDKPTDLLIIDKNVFLYESDSVNSKRIKGIDFLDQVSLIKESTNKKIFVVTSKGGKGWIDSSNTTIIPSNWKKIDCYDGLSISIPPNVKFTLEKGKLEKHRIGKKYIESKEDLIYAENNFSILINRSNELFFDVLENQKRLDNALHRNSNYIEKEFKGKKIIFKKSIGLDFNQELLVFFPYEKNNCISICISPESSDPSQEKFRTILKILFSFELKNEK